MTPFQSTWQSSLPADEIARQQAVKEQLQPGCTVTLQFGSIPLGEFTYTGLWDTMHTFYPLPRKNQEQSAAGEATGENSAPAIPDLHQLVPADRHRYLRRDLRGRWFIQLPYTILADTVTSITHNQ